MTNPIFSPQPNYSGVTIQIANPTVNTNPMIPPQDYNKNVGYISCPQAYYCNPQGVNGLTDNRTNPQATNAGDTGFQTAYPAQYYLNNYNYQGNGDLNASNPTKDNRKEGSVESYSSQSISDSKEIIPDNRYNSDDSGYNDAYTLKHYDTGKESKQNDDMTKSASIINDIDERDAKIKAEKQNTKETRVVALTDEYIKSLENYLNNPNDEIRLMASKEILTRLDEDKDRFDDAALNALLNKMLQDPSKLVRIAALSAFGSQLASGNDYTVRLLQNIQANPSADKEDVLQAADILLKMSAGTEVKNIPTPKKETNK